MTSSDPASLPIETATVRISFTPNDAVRGASLANRRPLSGLAFALLGGMVLLLSISLLLSGETALGLGIAMAVVGAYLIGSTYATWAAWMLARRHPEVFRREILARLNESGLHASQGASTSLRAWEDMSDYVEDAKYVVIRYSRMPVAIIPKRAFENAGEAATFLAVLSAHLPRVGMPPQAPASDIRER